MAAALAAATTFGLLADGGGRETVDQALSSLLLTTLPIAACLGVWSPLASEEPLLGFGKNRRHLLLLEAMPLLIGFPCVMLALGYLVLLWTRGAGDPKLLADVLSTAPVAFIASVASLLLSLAVREWFGRVGVVVLLLVLLTVGQSELAAAAVLPSAHVRHLLGVGAALPFDPGWSMGALWAFAVLAFLGWVARVPP